MGLIFSSLMTMLVHNSELKQMGLKRFNVLLMFLRMLSSVLKLYCQFDMLQKEGTRRTLESTVCI
jgi:hypothetical protein